MISTSESLLLRLKTPHDSEAWSRFVDLYSPLIFRWARNSGLQASDAADLVQEVLALTFRKLPSFEYNPTQSFRGWLRTVTLNKHREICRRNSIGLAKARSADLDKLSSQAESTWDLNYQQELVAQALEIARHEFRPKTWQALHEFVTTQTSAAEIGSRLGVSASTIYGAKSRLMVRLRELLEGLLE